MVSMTLLSCATSFDESRSPAQIRSWVDDLPQKTNSRQNLTAEQKYLSFLQLPKAENEKVRIRLSESNLQFLKCSDLNDWTCLEKYFKPQGKAPHRTDTRSDLGAPIKVASPLKMQHFFTYEWYNQRQDKGFLDQLGRPTSDFQKTPTQPKLAERLAQIINEPWSGVKAAIYGIDGIGVMEKSGEINESLLGVFNGLKRSKNFQAVVDVEKIIKEGSKITGFEFEYPPTQALLQEFNTDSEMSVRTEDTASKIMHNKFFVFEKNNSPFSLWTGTANISKNCMGDENNSNMVLYIENREIAQLFKDEFLEMYQGNLQATKKRKHPFFGGQFKKDKRPNTNRYFQFSDGSEMRVHFSPTDDGEHRAILPMIFSAEAGDILRLSMFATGGFEMIRALELAAARGVLVKVFLDSSTNFQISNSWINRNSAVRLGRTANPYATDANSLEVRLTKWSGSSKNHQKVATLTRKKPSGFRAEVLIVGSQNWSDAGNDENDENMITVRNLRSELAAAKDFNTHFDKYLWPTGTPLEE